MKGSGPSKLTGTDKLTPNIPNLVLCHLLSTKTPFSIAISRQQAAVEEPEQCYRDCILRNNLRRLSQVFPSHPLQLQPAPMRGGRSHLSVAESLQVEEVQGRHWQGDTSSVDLPETQSRCFLCCFHHVSPVSLWCLSRSIRRLEKGPSFPVRSKGNPRLPRRINENTKNSFRRIPAYTCSCREGNCTQRLSSPNNGNKHVL